MNRGLAAILCALALALATLIFVQSSAGTLLVTRVPVPNASIQQQDERLFRISSKKITPFLENLHPRAVLLDNGQPLPVPVTSSLRVKEGKDGSYIFGGKTIWFNTADGSDPRTNGHTYVLRFPRYMPSWTIGLAVALLALATAFGCKALWDKSAAQLFRTGYLGNLRAGPAEASNERQWTLDVLRALAMLLVLGCHVVGVPEEDSPLLHAITKVSGHGGWVGVDIFFVLSGYLVSGLLWSEWRRNGSINIGRFLLRRGFKIYPAFWGMTIFTLLGMALFHPVTPPVTVDGVIGEFFFLQYYISGMWGPTWSLSVEEHFYLFLALLFAVLAYHTPGTSSDMRSKLRLFPRIFLLIAIVSLLTRFVRCAFMGPEAWKGNYFATHLRLDALMFGVFLRHCQIRWPEAYERVARKGGWWWMVLAIGLLIQPYILNLGADQWTSSFILTLNYIGSGCLLLSMPTWSHHDGLRKMCRPFSALGRESYSIYLWHVPVLGWVATPVWYAMSTSHPTLARWVAFLIYVFGSIIVGTLMSILIERPMLRLRDQLFPSSTKAAVPRSEP